MNNVLQILDFGAPYRGNLIESLEILEKIANNQNYHFIYLFPKSAENLDWCVNMKNSEKKIYFINTNFFSKKITKSNISLITHIIKSNKINIIHTNFIEYNYTLFLIKNLFCRNIKIIGQFQNHFMPPKNLYRGMKIFLTKMIFDKIIAVSESVEESIINAKINKNKVTTIYNSIAPERLDRFETLELRNNPNQKVILMFGWPFLRKGVDIALDVIQDLIKKNKDIILAISISGNRPLIEKEILNKFGCLPNWVILLTPREDVATYYNASDIFISPSREEGFTFAVLEACYCKCNVVVSNIGGNPKNIKHIEIFNLGENQIFTNKINKLLSLSEIEKIEIKKSQRKDVLEKYDIKKWANQIIEQYKKLT